jgi:PAS domain S-box-containing protein
MTSSWKDELRGRAAEALRRHHLQRQRSDESYEALREELEIHAVELEMQNEELRETQAALLHERDHYRALFADAPVALVNLDAAGAIREVNGRASELLGETADDLHGVPFSRFVSAEHAETYTYFQRALLSDLSTRSEVKLAVKGRERIVELSSVWGVDRRLLALVDLTELRLVEAQVAQAQKLEALAMAMSGIAHDFNNLLFGIGGCADLALQMVGEESDAAKPLKRLKQAVASGGAVVRNLLQFARSDSPSHEVFDLHELLERNERLLRQVAGKEVEVGVHLEAPHAAIEGDPVQLEQVLLNLVVNARQAMPVGGTLEFRTHVEALDAQSARSFGLGDGDHLVLSVSDSGIGMDEDTQRRAFEPFYSTKPKGVGTGLGLPTVYRIVKRARGHIAVTSTPGAGTTFRIYLPLSTEPPSRKRRRPESVPPKAPGATVLVIEDDPLAQQTACQYLERVGYRVLSASSRSEVLEQCERHQDAIDVVLTDVVLKDTTGVALGQEIAACCPNAVLIYMSGHPREKLLEQRIAPPGNHLLLKPFDGDELGRVVNRAAALARREEDTAPLLLLVAPHLGTLADLAAQLTDARFRVLTATPREAPRVCIEHGARIVLAIVHSGYRDDAERPTPIELAGLAAMGEHVPLVFIAGDASADKFRARFQNVAAILHEPFAVGDLVRLVCTLAAQHDEVSLSALSAAERPEHSLGGP